MPVVVLDALRISLQEMNVNLDVDVFKLLKNQSQRRWRCFSFKGHEHSNCKFSLNKYLIIKKYFMKNSSLMLEYAE